MKLLLQFVSFVSLLSTVKTQALYDCDTGCSLDANIMGSPVCGEDNLTYLNECLAFCQVRRRVKQKCMIHIITSILN